MGTIHSPREAGVLELARMVARTGGTACWASWFQRITARQQHRARMGRRYGAEIEEERQAFQAAGEIADRDRWLLVFSRLPEDDGDDGAATLKAVPPSLPGRA